MVVRRGRGPEATSSSEDSGSGSGSCSFSFWHRQHTNMPNRHAINRQVALNTLAAMHRRFSIPSAVGTVGRPPAEFRASANKSLDILRQNIQAAVTKDIDQVIKKYLEKFFVPAVNNIRTNLGEESVSEEQLRAICRAMLDGARTLYAAPPRPSVPSRPAPSPSEMSDSESSNGADSRFGRPGSSPSYGKRKESDTDSDVGTGARRKRRAENQSNYAHKWDPARLTNETLFIMGSIANKVLGLGQSRGRLYSKHSGLLRYPADSADKEWIANQNLKTSSGGRTYIMVLEDIEELIVSEDYRNSSSLRLSELSCFRAPPFMLRKIQAYISQRGEMSEDYASSTPTPTPPPIEAPLSGPPFIKEEVSDEQVSYDANPHIKLENIKEEVISDDGKVSQAEPTGHLTTNQHEITNDDVNRNNNLSLPNFATMAGISSLDNNFWKTVSNNQLLGESSKSPFDTNIKVEMTSAAELMDADIEFLSGDFCSYAESEADVKKSFDKISDDSGEIFLESDNATLLGERIQGTEIGNPHIMNINRSIENTTPKSQVVTSIIGNIAVGSLPSQLHTYVTASNSPPVSSAIVENLQSSSQFSVSQVPTSFCQSLPSFSQIAGSLQGHLITPANLQTSGQITRVTWQPTATRTVYSLANTSRGLPSTIPPGSTLVSIGSRASGSILATSGSFINITPKNFSSGNILHNAIVSRNMVNRGLNANKVDLPKTNHSNVNTVVTKQTVVLPSVTTFSRVSLPSKIDDDMSITTTKAMIDNTCNSSAMLKQVLTLGSAGVNKTFLTPPTQKTNAAKPSTSASSTLSASHATLSALLSGIDPSPSDKKGSFMSKGDK